MIKRVIINLSYDFKQNPLRKRHQRPSSPICHQRSIEKIRYVAENVTLKWRNPEEKVRAASYAELIFRYGYSPECIGVEVTVPDRTPADRVDLVIFHDRAHTKPFALIECKRDRVSDTEFKPAIEQSFGNGHAHKFRANYVGVVAGQTRAFF